VWLIRRLLLNWLLIQSLQLRGGEEEEAGVEGEGVVVENHKGFNEKKVLRPMIIAFSLYPLVLSVTLLKIFNSFLISSLFNMSKHC
jgi:hypothetical protein